MLKRAGIALWDVLAAAERQGSLDADILWDTCEVNDIAGLLRRYQSIRLIGFNGQTAAAIFRRYVAPQLPRADIEFLTLPSSSPAHATLSLEQKRKRWHAALAPYIRAD
jgi:hypoxanthine-DNA glycosylase